MRSNVNATTMTPQLTFAGRRADLRLEAPERHNALGPEDLRALSIALEKIERSDAEVAVIRSSGDTFCSGYDLRALREEIRVGSTSAAERAFANVADTLETLRVPTICALQGGVYGGGSDLALACDFRVGTPQTVLNVPAARFGLQFYSGGLRRFVERLGVDAAKRVFLLAETLDANELLRIGFLYRLVDLAELDETVDTLALQLAANAKNAVRGLKRSLNAIARGIGDTATIDDAFAASLRSPETATRLSPPRERR
jgi:enoyl-CoA hydratase/carnithine racemase